MVLFFTCTLLISLFAMAALLLAKRYELSTGRVIFASMRPGMNSFFHRLSVWSQKILPALARGYIERGAKIALTRLQLGLAHIIVVLERTLENVLSAVRERTEELHAGEPSAFLREVADHKKNLLKKSRPRDTVREEE